MEALHTRPVNVHADNNTGMPARFIIGQQYTGMECTIANRGPGAEIKVRLSATA